MLFFCGKDLHLPEPLKQDQSEILQQLSVSLGSSQKVETAKVSIFNYLKSSFLSIELIIVLIKLEEFLDMEHGELLNQGKSIINL